MKEIVVGSKMFQLLILPAVEVNALLCENISYTTY